MSRDQSGRRSKRPTLADTVAEQEHTVDELAAALDADVDQVERWIAGEVPPLIDRRRLALIVGIPSRTLWPEATAEHDAVALTCDQLWKTPAEAWRTLAESADERIDILGGGYGWFVMHGAEDGAMYTGDFRSIIDEKRSKSGGPDLRICMSHPYRGDVRVIQGMQESTVDDFKGKSLKHSRALVDGIELWVDALQGLDRAELRLAERGAYVAWMARFDNRIVWVPQLWGTRSHVGASYLVERDDIDGRFDELSRHFDTVWDFAGPGPVEPSALRAELEEIDRSSDPADFVPHNGPW